MKSHYKRSIEMADRGMESLLARNIQDLNPTSRNYGGILDPQKGFAEPGSASGVLDNAISLYYNESSKHNGNDELLDRAHIAIDFLLAKIHEDGTIDMMETNFHDATSIAFITQGLAYTYRLIAKHSKGTQKEMELENKIHNFLKASAEGLLNGGFHTPNHRWVMTSALSLLYNILGDERLKREAKVYLQEGIDCDEDGEYTERSTGVYNVINNRSLIIIAEELNMPELYEHVKRNLYMMFYYIEPDHSLCTMNSRRQDYGSMVYANIYYENYILTALKTGDPILAWMGDFWFNILYNRNKGAFMPYEISGSPMSIAKYMLDENLVNFVPEKIEEPDLNYERFFEKSGIARYRKGNMSWTLVKERSPFFKFQHGAATLHLRFAASFFGTLGRFIPQDIIKLDNGGYRVSYKKQWGYKKPFDTPPHTSVWDEMDHTKRKNVMMQDHIVHVDVLPEEDGVLLEVQVDGVENVPYKLEIMLQDEGFIETEDLSMPTTANGHAFLKSNGALYSYKDYGIEICGGFYEHRYGPTMRGSEGKDPNVFTLYMTGFSGDKQQLRIRATENNYTGGLKC